MHALPVWRPSSPSPRNILIAGVISAVLVGYVAPVHDLLTQRDELVKAQSALEASKVTRRSLQSQLRSTQRADVLERRARAQGAVKPGERAFIVEDPNGANGLSSPAAVVPGS